MWSPRFKGRRRFDRSKVSGYRIPTTTPSRRYKSQGFSRGGVSRSLTYERVERPLGYKCLMERHHGDAFALTSNCDTTSFISYPVRALSGEGRSRDYIKLLSIRASGVINVKGLVKHDAMERSTNFSGVFVMALVMDMKPYLPEGSNQLPSFVELFGPYSSAYVTLRLLDNQTSRFRILTSVSKMVYTQDDSRVLQFKCYRRFTHSRYPIWASFYDHDIGNSGGNYRNISRNAVLVSYAFVSEQSMSCVPFVQFETRYIG
uniref:Nuclear shuttle protein n=1 Tax=Desmodium mottle virus TaxID=1960710 RepID=A0A1S6GNC7_9GEMI|nr:NSP [Desmodium mottle virus]